MIVVDSSALIAVLFAEPEKQAFQVNDSMIPMCDHPRAEPLPSARPIQGRAMAIIRNQPNAEPSASNSSRHASLNSRSGSIAF
jgi:hypothetical protein